jgi:hypothetical protein
LTAQGSNVARAAPGRSAAPYSWNNPPPREPVEGALAWLRRCLKAERQLLADQEVRGQTMFEQGDDTFEERFGNWDSRHQRYMKLSRLIGEPD